VRSEVRHRLKEDRFAETAQGTFSWLREHGINVVGGTIVATLIIAAALGVYYYMENHEQKASTALGSAMDTLNAHVGAADANPEGGGDETYSSVKDRGQAAQKKLEAVANEYPHTHSGKIARYLVGAAEVQQGNNAAAEATFKQVAASGDKDVASLAKLAMAALYRSMNRNQDAIAIYKDLADHPTHEVSKLAAQFELAGIYENTQPDEARKLYQQIKDSDPDGTIGQQAMMKMFGIRGGSSPFPMQMPR
jgi:predicted negative regulator of RcsB-dependent stress response